MDSKLDLTKSQLETILRLINDVNLNKENVDKLASKNSAIKLQSNSTIKKTATNLSKKRSYSAINLNLKNLSNEDLISESISNLIKNKKDNLVPKIKTTPIKQLDQPTKLRRNKSLIELKKEKWERERNELKNIDSWYEKFDSFKKIPIDRSRSQPNIINNNYNDLINNRYDSASQLFSPISNFNENESIALSNTYTAIPSPQSLTNFESINQLNNQLIDDQLLNRITNQSPNQFTFNQPARRSFRRYAHQFNNVNILEKRRKQQEYQAQLEAQLAHKRQLNKLKQQQQLEEEKKFEEKLFNEQQQLRKEFEIDHKELLSGKKVTMKDKRNELTNRKNERKSTDLERLEIKSKELIKLFKDSATQTDDLDNQNHNQQIKTMSTQTNDLLINKWQFNNTIKEPLQPLRPVTVKSNRSAILRTNSRPKWTQKQNSTKDDDNKTSILPKLSSNQKGSQLTIRKKWNS